MRKPRFQEISALTFGLSLGLAHANPRPVQSAAAVVVDAEFSVPGRRLIHRTVAADAASWTNVGKDVRLNYREKSPGVFWVQAEVTESGRLIAKPILLTRLGRSAKIEQTDDAGKVLFRIKVRPRAVE